MDRVTRGADGTWDVGAYEYNAGGGGDTTPPSAPTLSASVVSSSQINLSWTASTDNVGVTGYQIYRGGSLLTTVTGTSYSNTGLTANTQYSYYVRAKDDAGNGTNSNTVTATTQAGTPAPTATISANPTSVSSGGSSTLTWSSTNATSCTASGGWSGSKAVSGTQTLTNLTATATYSITCTGAGGTSPAASATVTVSGGGGVGTYSIFTTQTPAGSYTDGTGVNYELGTKFMSNTAGQITGIRFYKASQETGTATRTGRIWSSTGTLLASVVFSGETASGWQTQNLTTPLSIAANTTYVVSVNTRSAYYVATNNGLASSISNGPLSTIVGANGVYGNPGAYPTNTWQASNYFRDVVFTTGTPGDTTAPSTPTNLAAIAISSSQINLTWNASTDNVAVTGYQIFRDGTLLTTVTGTSYSNTGLTPSTAYSYYVRATDAAGNFSANSNTVSATTQAATPPPTVMLSANPQSIGTGDSSTLSWTSSNASSCTGTGFSTGGTTSGSAVVTPSATTVYSISCTGAGGTGTNTVTVSVGALAALPTIDFPSGTFTWTTTNAVSCSASGGWTGAVGTSGSYTFSTPLSSTYVLTCSGGGTTVQRTITITTSETATVSSKFTIGQTVTASSNLNVRTTPSTSGTLLGSQPAGVTGSVTGGPVLANGYWWWQVNFATGPDGWSVENWLN